MQGFECDVCGRPITLTNAALGFDEHGWSVGVGHHRCLPQMGYHVDLDRLLRDGLDGERGWCTHLRRKVWFDLDAEMALLKAHDVAQAMGARIAPPIKETLPAMRSAVASIPRRPPRPSDNPRSISTTMRSRVLERDGFHCRRCGHGPDVAPLVVDHVVPVAKGGKADFDNLQTLCRPCNAGKSDREPTPHDLGARS